MARIRTIKPAFFTHHALAQLEFETELPCRLAFAGLWTQADREGRFKWRPEELKVAILPYDLVDFGLVLEALTRKGFLKQYVADGHAFGYIPSWHDHQSIPSREPASVLPASPVEPDQQATLFEARNEQCSVRAEGKGRERKGKELTSANADVGVEQRPPECFIALPLNDGTSREIHAQEIDGWQQLYPAVDIGQALRNMYGWCSSKPRNRKTSRGIDDFIHRWLRKEQDRGGPARKSNEPNVSFVPPRSADKPVPSDAIPDGLDIRTAESLWPTIRNGLMASINRQSFDTWIKPLRPLGIKDGSLYLRIPNSSFSHVAERYGPHFKQFMPTELSQVKLLNIGKYA